MSMEVRAAAPNIETLTAEAAKQPVKTAEQPSAQAAQAVPAETAEAADTRQLFDGALKNYGLKPTEENRARLAELVSKNLPLDKATVTQYIRAFKMLESADKALFLIKNQIPITTENVRILNELAEGTKLAALMEALSQSIDGLPAQVKQVVADALLQGGAAETAVNFERSQGLGLPRGEPVPQGAAAEQTADGIAKAVVDNVTSLTADADGTPAANAASGERQTAANQLIRQALANAELPEAALRQLAEKLTEALPGQAAVINEETNAVIAAKNRITDSGAGIKAEIITMLNETPEIINDSAFPEKITQAVLKHIAAPDEAAARPATPRGTDISRGDIIRALTEIFADDHEILTKLTEALRRKPEAEGTLFGKLFDRFKAEPSRGLADDLEKLLNELHQNTNTAKTALLTSSADTGIKTAGELGDIGRRMELANQMKTDLYLQIPFMLNNERTTAELFIFGGKKHAKKPKEAVSALVALDTASMGRFEVFVEKNGRNVGCSFRLESDEVESTVRAAVDRLNTLLFEYGYTLSKYSFLRISEPFTVLDEEPRGDELGIGLENMRLGVNYRV